MRNEVASATTRKRPNSSAVTVTRSWPDGLQLDLAASAGCSSPTMVRPSPSSSRSMVRWSLATVTMRAPASSLRVRASSRLAGVVDEGGQLGVHRHQADGAVGGVERRGRHGLDVVEGRGRPAPRGRRRRRDRGGSCGAAVRVGDQRRTQPLEVALAGRADRADRDVEQRRDLLVARGAGRRSAAAAAPAPAAAGWRRRPSPRRGARRRGGPDRDRRAGPRAGAARRWAPAAGGSGTRRWPRCGPWWPTTWATPSARAARTASRTAGRRWRRRLPPGRWRSGRRCCSTFHTRPENRSTRLRHAGSSPARARSMRPGSSSIHAVVARQ